MRSLLRAGIWTLVLVKNSAHAYTWSHCPSPFSQNIPDFRSSVRISQPLWSNKETCSGYLKSLPLSAFRADGPGDCSLLTLHSRFANASCQQLIGAPFLKIALKSRNTALTNHWALVCSSWPLRGQSCLKGNSNVLLSHSVAHHELQHIPRACLSNPSNFIIQPVLYQLNYLRWHIVVSLCAELESNQILCSPFFILIISVLNACRVDNTHLTFLKACG